MKSSDILKLQETITNLDLEIENYMDNTKNYLDSIKDINKDMKEFKLKETTIDEKTNFYKDIINRYYKVIDFIGKDKFIFHNDEDGEYIEYIWDEELTDKLNSEKYEENMKRIQILEEKIKDAGINIEDEEAYHYLKYLRENDKTLKNNEKVRRSSFVLNEYERLLNSK